MRSFVRDKFDFASFREPIGRLLLVLFLITDTVLILFHLTHTLIGSPWEKAFDLGVDRSFGELLIAIKLCWILVLCLLIAWRRRSPVFVGLALVSLLVFAEDFLRLHERVGQALAPDMREAFPFLAEYGILALQAGELVWFAGISSVILIVFVAGYLKSERRDRRAALAIAAFFGVLAFFAIVVDTVHSFFHFGTTADLVLTMIEDGGEMVALSPAVALALALAVQVERVAAEQAKSQPD